MLWMDEIRYFPSDCVTIYLSKLTKQVLIVLVPLDVACRKPARGRYCMHGCKVQSAPTTTVSCISSLHAYSYIQQSGHSVKTMNAKNTKKSLIHENADVNITCDFGDGNISRFSTRPSHTHGHTHGHIVSSIIIRYHNRLWVLYLGCTHGYLQFDMLVATL